jgi:hypothetical protein
MTMMATIEIINEIDAYLSRLRQARELLLHQKTGTTKTRAPRRKMKVTPGQAPQASSRIRRAEKNKSPSNPSFVHLKKRTERVDIVAQVPSPVPDHHSDLVLPAIAQSEHSVSQKVIVKKLPPRGLRALVRSVRHRTPKPTLDPKPDAAKPAIALAGPQGAKIVVVPAEQVRREREEAAQPEVRRPRLPLGLTGRLAFEALFK